MNPPMQRPVTMSRAGTTQETAAVQATPDPVDGEPREEAVGALEASGLTTLRERQFAATSWLLGAADDRDLARRQWDDQGIALLCCGGILAAVRIPARLVWAIAKTEQLEKVDAFLGEWFDGGAMFMDVHSHMYYALVPGTPKWPLNDRDFPGVDCLGRDNFLGVPASRLTRPKGRAYWCLPMQSPGDLCYVDEVEKLVRIGRAVLAEGGGR
ncbi:hypothetical protein [Streptomyces blattellae]|uniref:hypothetical protein n=1 Tax=Streptomyces blattellae TaxID=2569855 RepID=UPI0012B6B436|nr:hypothetical protein [Streptomyces blattellae]